MKKLFNLFLALLFVMAIMVAPRANAAEIADIDADYWANAEIQQMVTNGIMNLDSQGRFNPNSPVERADFTSMLIKVLGQSNLEIYVQNPFSDVNANTKHYDDIMRSEQIGLVYGYPDGTFRPKHEVIKAEVTSAMSHITKDTVYDLSALENFIDADAIPAWAKEAYAKAVKYNLYVNYPDRSKFEPNREMTRAETAVLLARLQNAISNVKEEYKAEEVERSLSVEHLSINSKAENNTVTVTNRRKIVSEGNILKVNYLEKFKSKDANIGDTVVFVAEKDVVTDEGTLVIPEGTKFYASVEDIVQPKKMNKAGAVKFNFNRLELPGGLSTSMNATAFNNLDGYLKNKAGKKLGKYTLGGLVAGAAVGSAIGWPLDEVGTAYGVGLPVGAAGGFIVGLFTKGPDYRADKGDELYIQLNEALSVQDSL